MPTLWAARKFAKMAISPDHRTPPLGEPSIWHSLARAVAAEDRLCLWVLTALIGLAAAIRIFSINRPMNYDEAYTYLTYASRPLSVAPSNYSMPNNHLWHTALGFYTVPTMLYGFLGLAFWYAVIVLIYGAPEMKRAQWLALAAAMMGAALLTVFLYLPVVISSGVGALTRSSTRLSASLSNARLWSMTCDTIKLVHQGMPILLPVFFLLCLVIHVFHPFRRYERHGQLLLLLGMLFAGILVILLQRAVPYERSWLYLLPVCFICVASGLEAFLELEGQRFARRLAVIVALVLLVLVNLHAWTTLPACPQNLGSIDRVGAFIASQLRPGDAFGAKAYWAMPIACYMARAGHAIRKAGGFWALQFWEEPFTNGLFKRDTVRRLLLALRPIVQPKADRFLRERTLKQDKQYKQRDLAKFGTWRIVEVSGAGLSMRRPRRPLTFERISPRRRAKSFRRYGPFRPYQGFHQRHDRQNALTPRRLRLAGPFRIPEKLFPRGDHDIPVGKITVAFISHYLSFREALERIKPGYSYD